MGFFTKTFTNKYGDSTVEPRYGPIIGTAFAAILGIAVVLGGTYKISEPNRGVLTTNGAFSQIVQPGLNFKIPFFQGIHSYSLGENVTLFDNVETYSFDQQLAQLRISVNWAIAGDSASIERAFREGYRWLSDFEQRIVERRTPDAMKAVFGTYTASRAIQDRAVLNAAISDAITTELESSGLIRVINIQVEDVAFSEAYEQAVEARMTAEVEVTRFQQTAERERVQAEIRVIQAQAEADARVAQATAEAEAIRLQGEAEAYAIDARGQALRDNPQLVQLVTAERWNGVLPTTMIPGDTVPFLAVNEIGQELGR